MMRSVEINKLRKHVRAEVSDNLPFYIVSGGIRVAVIIKPREYNRLKLIEHIERERREHDKKLGMFIDKTLWHNQELPLK